MSDALTKSMAANFDHYAINPHTGYSRPYGSIERGEEGKHGLEWRRSYVPRTGEVHNHGSVHLQGSAVGSGSLGRVELKAGRYHAVAMQRKNDSRQFSSTPNWDETPVGSHKSLDRALGAIRRHHEKSGTGHVFPKVRKLADVIAKKEEMLTCDSCGKSVSEYDAVESSKGYVDCPACAKKHGIKKREPVYGTCYVCGAKDSGQMVGANEVHTDPKDVRRDICGRCRIKRDGKAVRPHSELPLHDRPYGRTPANAKMRKLSDVIGKAAKSGWGLAGASHGGDYHHFHQQKPDAGNYDLRSRCGEAKASTKMTRLFPSLDDAKDYHGDARGGCAQCRLLQKGGEDAFNHVSEGAAEVVHRYHRATAEDKRKSAMGNPPSHVSVCGKHWIDGGSARESIGATKEAQDGVRRCPRCFIAKGEDAWRDRVEGEVIALGVHAINKGAEPAVAGAADAATKGRPPKRAGGSKPGAVFHRTQTGYEVVASGREHPIPGGQHFEVHPVGRKQKVGEIYANPIGRAGETGIHLQPVAISHDGVNLGEHDGFDAAVQAIASHFETAEGAKQAAAQQRGSSDAIHGRVRAALGGGKADGDAKGGKKTNGGGGASKTSAKPKPVKKTAHSHPYRSDKCGCKPRPNYEHQHCVECGDPVQEQAICRGCSEPLCHVCDGRRGVHNRGFKKLADVIAKKNPPFETCPAHGERASNLSIAERRDLSRRLKKAAHAHRFDADEHPDSESGPGYSHKHCSDCNAKVLAEGGGGSSGHGIGGYDGVGCHDCHALLCHSCGKKRNPAKVKKLADVVKGEPNA